MSSSKKQQLPFGSWRSELSSKIACGSSISLVRMYVDPYDNESIYWSEHQPEQQGRTLVLSQNVNTGSTAKPTKWTQDQFTVHDTVHEYGGAAFLVNRGALYFSNLKFGGEDDNMFYKQNRPEDVPTLVTRQSSLYRYADPDFSKNGDFLFLVREVHTKDENETKIQPVNRIVAVNVKTGKETIVDNQENDFFSTPRVSPDGTKLVYVTWCHPNMPWDNTELWVADFSIVNDEIKITKTTKVAGKDGVNYMEPQWTSDNKLMYICDLTGWWNLYLHNLDNGIVQNVYVLDEEIGQPCWNFGDRCYSPNPVNKDEVLTLYGSKPSLLNMATEEKVDIVIPESSIANSCAFMTNGKYIFLNILSPLEPSSIWKYDVGAKTLTPFHYVSEMPISSEYLSKPVLYQFDTTNDDPSDPNKILTAYGYYYPPQNALYEGPPGEYPPVLIKIHGGPTAAASLGLNFEKQYFTSRGIGIFDVNYRGSTGYGTAYRQSLKGKWGVYDLIDCQKAAQFLVKEKLAGANRILMSGGSSGGYTTLACFNFKNESGDNFASGASYYGISDMSTLAQETHKFESHYCDEMVAPYPEHKEVYDERSPIMHKEQFQTACAFFQGAEDKVVPPKQSDDMYQVLKEAGITTSYNLYQNEGHGFTQPAHKENALDGEFYFYSVILGFEPAENLQGVITIDNPPKKK